MLAIGAIILGLLINYFTGGLPFSTLLCIFAGVFMLMPSFLTISNHELIHRSYRKQHHSSIITMIIAHLLIIILAWLIGWLLVGDIPALHYGLILLAMISGGGLLPARIRKTNGDMHLAIRLFIVSMVIFTGLFFVYHRYIDTHVIQTLIQSLTCDMETVNLSCGSGNISPINGIMILLVMPFVLSRIIRLFPKMTAIATKYSKLIGTIATTLIITYIFSLEQVHAIFTTSGQTLIQTTISVGLLYLITGGVSYRRRTKQPNTERTTTFWLMITRFITFGMVMSFIYIQWFGTDIMLPFIIAYLIQIPGSVRLTHLMTTDQAS